MLGKNVKLFIDRMTEGYREQLLDIFNSGNIDFSEYGSFYEEGPICNIDEAETAYKLDMLEKEINDLKDQNKLLRAEINEHKKEVANNFFKEMGILNK